MERELIVMKRSHKDPETGDVFVVQPKKGAYYYGKVIEASVNSHEPSFQNWYLVYVYDFVTGEKRTDISLEGVPLLIAPMVVNKRPWTMGYVETITKSDISEYDRSIDFGFVNVLNKRVYDIRGRELRHNPRYLGVLGLGSFGAIKNEIHKVLETRAL